MIIVYLSIISIYIFIKFERTEKSVEDKTKTRQKLNVKFKNIINLKYQLYIKFPEYIISGKLTIFYNFN